MSTTAAGTAVGYPLYDAHGNRTATLTKSGSSLGLVDVRSYDAWGNVRYGSGTGRPRGRYVANLGHVQDDESGLVYMRARYYEPGSGRFVSEDPSADGVNWFVYCGNDPVNRLDTNGKEWSWEAEFLLGVALIVVGYLMIVGISPQHQAVADQQSRALEKMTKDIKAVKGNPVAQAAIKQAQAAKETAEGLSRRAGCKAAASKYLGYMMCISGAILDIDAWDRSDGQRDVLLTAAKTLGWND
jgi:RHS repeat-associated protein